MESKLKELKTRLLEIGDLSSVSSLLYWDQSTYMPPGGAAARGRQMATLEKLAHEKFIDPAVGELLDALQSYEKTIPYDSDDASLIRVARRDYEKATCVPSSFVEKQSKHGAECYEIWAKARPENNFKLV